ncbi:unnamed protein product [Rhodiola kirilowii]
MSTPKFALLITTMKKRKMDALPSLAGDMIEEILKKLPVKALIRFKTVCKSWHVLISSPRFHALQRKVFVFSDISCLSNYCVSLLVNYSRSASLKLPAVSSSTAMTQIPDELKLVFSENTRMFTSTVGSCNGVYLVRGFESRVYALWNLATKDHKLILSQGSNCEFEFDYGFGSEEFVEGGFDFLVLKLCRKGEDGEREAPQLYRSSTGFWKDLPDYHDEYNDVLPLTEVVYINGVFYWLDSAEDVFSLVSFDTRSETFEKTDVHCLNRLFRGSKFPSAVLTWYKSHGTKLLAIMIYLMRKQIDLWVMRESGKSRSWVKEASIMVYTVRDNESRAVADDPKADIWYSNVFQYEESLAKLS